MLWRSYTGSNNDIRCSESSLYFVHRRCFNFAVSISLSEDVKKENSNICARYNAYVEAMSAHRAAHRSSCSWLKAESRRETPNNAQLT